jgi:predicted phosphodiesterase
VRTLIVSDLHLGARNRTDLLQAEVPRARLLGALADADRVVLLGDVLELRQDPARDALARARPVLQEIGAAAGEAELVLVPGNHDYGLIAPWLDARGRDTRPAPLGLEHRVDPGQASPIAALVASWLAPAPVSIAYPGVWLREDVYATHGHYLDCHATVPTMERLAAGLMTRLVTPLPDGDLEADDYEALLAPIYAWMEAVTERSGGHFGMNSIRAWRLLAGGRRRSLRARVLAHTFPLGVAALNRVGLGPLSADLSRAALRRAGVRAMAEVCDRLSVPARHVVFGHSHRAGPLPADDHFEWRTGDVRLTNSGCWVYESRMMSAGMSPRSPFWPGAGVVLEDGEGPALRRFLDGVPLAG